ncbi:MAG: rhodanese-like domain-containing protein [Thalassotalea sp.]|nr:rhodanese-like domain-containing protein [Thalassotalea sp.]MDG2394185.1 rhodanese-like domain-containing protein [Thalassotalea sp.]
MLKAIPELIMQAAQNVRRIPANQAKGEIAENNGLLIDVREPQEFVASAADGAINIPRGVLEMRLVELEKDAKRPIYLHCATAGRATLAAEQLARVGYENVTCISCKFDIIKAEF